MGGLSQDPKDADGHKCQRPRDHQEPKPGDERLASAASVASGHRQLRTRREAISTRCFFPVFGTGVDCGWHRWRLAVMKTYGQGENRTARLV